jgi:hypothetical protein
VSWPRRNLKPNGPKNLHRPVSFLRSLPVWEKADGQVRQNADRASRQAPVDELATARSRKIGGGSGSEFAAKLSAARSIPEAMMACREGPLVDLK